MGYMHIQNLYRSQEILIFKECFALEKIHGTSAHVRWTDGKVWLHSGGEKHDRFAALFDEEALTAGFIDMGREAVTIYGEAYGGSQQKQAWRYGNQLRFVAFDVKIGDMWLAVPNAEGVVKSLGLEFVHYVRCSTDLPVLDAERDATSEQARRNGIEGFQPREGVVLRPIYEMTRNDGQRIIAKHKRAEERETKTPREVVDPAKQAVLDNAQAIADEWVTPTRLEHVLDKLGDVGIERTKDVISAMVDDVVREGAGEFVDSREARAAIGRVTAQLFKKRLQDSLREGQAAQ
jgi:hypothetical protein